MDTAEALRRAERGLALMARMHVVELARVDSEWTGEPWCGVNDAEVREAAAEFMQRVMAQVDAEGEDGGLLEVRDD